VTPVTVCDSTLRDGSHAKRHAFTVEEVRAVAGALDRAGVPYIEVSHGDGLGGSSLNYGRSAVDELELIAAAADVIERGTLAVLLLPGSAHATISPGFRSSAQDWSASPPTAPRRTSPSSTSPRLASSG
jgi:hypothetical protein